MDICIDMHFIPETDDVPDFTGDPTSAYGRHPLTNEMVEFKDVTVLRNTITSWYKLIDDHQKWDFLPNRTIMFCINCIYEEGLTQSLESEHYSIEKDGSINGRKMARIESCHFQPCIYRIVIPRRMYTAYIIRYSLP